jgi:hypothetical protein
VRYGFIASHRAQWPVRVMCRVLQVSPSGFYEWEVACHRNAASTTRSSQG